MAAVAVLTAALDSVAGAGADGGGPSGAIVGREAGPLGNDPLRELADDCLDGLAEVARWEARASALKVRLAATYLQATDAMAAPATESSAAVNTATAATAALPSALQSVLSIHPN